jgi:hypothetical protein
MIWMIPTVYLLVGQDINPDNMVFNPLDINDANNQYNDWVDPGINVLTITRNVKQFNNL